MCWLLTGNVSGPLHARKRDSHLEAVLLGGQITVPFKVEGTGHHKVLAPLLSATQALRGGRSPGEGSLLPASSLSRHMLAKAECRPQTGCPVHQMRPTRAWTSWLGRSLFKSLPWCQSLQVTDQLGTRRVQMAFGPALSPYEMYHPKLCWAAVRPMDFRGWHTEQTQLQGTPVLFLSCPLVTRNSQGHGSALRRKLSATHLTLTWDPSFSPWHLPRPFCM